MLSSLKRWAVALLGLVGLQSCYGQNTFEEMTQSLYKNTVPLVQAKEASQWKEAVFLDTRELEEYGVSHLPGAIHFGYNQPKWSTLFMVDKEKTVVVYCSVGYRSERIGEELLKRGYKKVYNLYGGIFDWVNQGYTVFRGDKATNKVHPYNKSWGRWLTKGEKAYR